MTDWKTGAAALLLAAGIVAPGPAVRAQEGPMLTLLGVRNATVAPDGVGFISGAWSSRRDIGDGFTTGDDDFIKDSDGSIVLGYGFGNADGGVGVQLGAHVTSLTDDFGDSGYLSVRASTRVLRYGGTPAFLGLGVDRIAPWGDAEPLDPSYTLALTGFPVASIGGREVPMMVTVGIGSHVADDDSEPGGYFGAGFGLSRNLAVSAAWTGEDVTAGAAFRLDALPDVTFTAAVDDLFDQTDSQRITLSATWTFDSLFGGY